MEPSIPHIPGKVCFFMQSGLIKDTVVADSNELTLKTLKDYACNFIDRKYPNHGLNRLAERLILFRHDYSSENQLLPINCASNVTEGALIEIVVSGNSPSDSIQVRPHSLLVHSYMAPAFCEFCGKMLFGLVRQGLKCEGCGLNFHKRCAYKIPNNCISGPLVYASQNSSSNNSLIQRTTSSGLSDDMSFLLNSINTSRNRSSSYSSTTTNSSLQLGRPLWVENEIASRIRVPHTFAVHSYKLPTICQYCRRLLRGLFRQGLQCTDCKFNVHQKCVHKIPNDCTGEAPKEWSENPEEEEEGVDEEEEEEDDEGEGEEEGRIEEDILEKADDKNESYLEYENVKSNGSQKEEPLIGTDINNIPLMRIIQSVKHIKSRSSKLLKEGWVSYYTNKDYDCDWKRSYWRLDIYGITMFQNEFISNCYLEIPLTQIIKIDWNRLQSHFDTVPIYCFEIKTTTINYYVGDDIEIAKTWKTAIGKTLIPLAPTANSKYVWTHLENSSDKRDIDSEYQIFRDEVLGAGQFGTVYLGINKSSYRLVAIKEIDKLKFPTKQDQLRNEFQILQNIEYPGVVNLEKIFEDSKRILLVMEKLSGDMLDMIINNKEPERRLSERVTKFLICQILNALRYLHSRNICHRDLKPENVLLSSKSDFPQIKLIDFGFARIIGERSFRQSIVGTPAYLAPEVLKKKRHNKSLDMWSVGVIIYVSLSGEFPFNNAEDIFDQITNARFMYPSDPWKHISTEAIDLISNLLEVDPRKRYTVEKSLLHPWLQDYEVWTDLRQLEVKVGTRWVTHRSDDDRWEKYRIAHNLPSLQSQTIISNENILNNKNQN